MPRSLGLTPGATSSTCVPNEYAALTPGNRRCSCGGEGRGYPDGLAGEEIPPSARILAATDAFEAITADRPYRPPSSVKQAVAILEEERGKQLDSRMVDALVGVLRQQGLINDAAQRPAL